MTKTLLWLDDCRNPHEDDWLVFSPIGRDVNVVWVKSYFDFTSWIKKHGLPDGICFDHDLGKELEINLLRKGANKKLARQLKAEEKTGYDAAKWLTEYCMKHKKLLPVYAIQSANSVGRENIYTYLENYKKHVELV